MNYLGHLLLSRDHEEVLIGNFLADRLNSTEQKNLPEYYQPGIRFHRWIDYTTDQHKEVKKMVSIIRPIYRRYAPVALDVYMDHLISTSWQLYTSEPWNIFKNRVYKTLREHSSRLPDGYNRGMLSMVDHDWLDQYGDIKGLAAIMRRLDIRARHSKPFESGLDELHAQRDLLQEHFDPFFRDMIVQSSQFF